MLRRVQKLGQVSLHASLLEGRSAAAPNGQVHCQVASVIEDVDDADAAKVREFSAGAEDVLVTDAALVNRARQLFADIAQHLADRDAVPVRASPTLTGPLVQPSR